MKVNLRTHVSHRKTCGLYLILTHWSYSKCKDILHMLSVYKIPAKERELVAPWATDEISVS